MPRHNRRAPQSARPIRVMSPSRQRALVRFAREHLQEHAYARSLDAEGAYLVMTGSECPVTGVRFLSSGARLDPLAVRLAGHVEDGEPSDDIGNLVA